MNLISAFLLGTLFLYFPCQAFGWDDMVVSVQAGDQLTVLRGGKKQPLQLYGLHCPPVKSVAGKQAMEYTAAKTLNKRAKIRPVHKEHLSLIEAVVFVGGHNLGASLIKAGWARVDQQRGGSTAVP